MWLLEAVTYSRGNALIEMYMNMVEGTKNELIEFMKKQVKDNCSKIQSYCISMCRRLDEKDDDDYIDDFR